MVGINSSVDHWHRNIVYLLFDVPVWIIRIFIVVDVVDVVTIIILNIDIIIIIISINIIIISILNLKSMIVSLPVTYSVVLKCATGHG